MITKQMHYFMKDHNGVVLNALNYGVEFAYQLIYKFEFAQSN